MGGSPTYREQLRVLRSQSCRAGAYGDEGTGKLPGGVLTPPGRGPDAKTLAGAPDTADPGTSGAPAGLEINRRKS